MPNYDYYCSECEEMSVHLTKYEERDTAKIPCQVCETILERRMSMPRVLKASYPDGMKREGWADMSAVAKLEKAKTSLNWRSDDVKAINKELDEREDRNKK